MSAWKEHVLAANGHDMAWYETGDGPMLLCLHGSYDHLLYRPMAELLADRFRCVLYDQRGSGRSKLTKETPKSMHIDRFVEDIDALRDHLGLERIALLGHSWGCSLGLLYAQAFPERVSALVLAGPGPLDAVGKDYYEANVLRMTDPADLPRQAGVRAAYKQARKSGPVPPDIDEVNCRVWAPVMFFSRDEAETFVDEYLSAGGYRRHVREATGFEREMQLARAERITAPTLVLYGYQDYEPITQAYSIKERIPQTQIVFLNYCGHMLWADQPQAFDAAITKFLGSCSV